MMKNENNKKYEKPTIEIIRLEIVEKLSTSDVENSAVIPCYTE
ncbi:MAG: hypothetical protein PHT83_04165 [Bacilli bacterium]|nr:hypothetical protein [Bacilli bacterium]